MGRNLCAQGFGFGVYGLSGAGFREVELLELIYGGGLEPALPEHLLPWRPDPSQSSQRIKRTRCRLGRRRIQKEWQSTAKLAPSLSWDQPAARRVLMCP